MESIFQQERHFEEKFLKFTTEITRNFIDKEKFVVQHETFEFSPIKIAKTSQINSSKNKDTHICKFGIKGCITCKKPERNASVNKDYTSINTITNFEASPRKKIYNKSRSVIKNGNVSYKSNLTTNKNDISVNLNVSQDISYTEISGTSLHKKQSNGKNKSNVSSLNTSLNNSIISNNADLNTSIIKSDSEKEAIFKKINKLEEKSQIKSGQFIEAAIFVGGFENNKYQNLLITGHYDGNINLFDISTNKLIKSYRKHSYYVSSIKYIGHYKTGYFISSSDGEIKMWDLNFISNNQLETPIVCKTPIKVFKTDYFIYVLENVFNNQQENKFISGDNRGNLKVWNLSNIDKKSSNLKIKSNKSVIDSNDKLNTSGIFALCHLNLITPFNLLLTGHNFGELFLFNIDNINEPKFTYSKEHSDKVNSIVYYKNNYFITCSSDSLIKMWKIDLNESIYSFNNHSAEIKSLSLVNDFLISSSQDKTIKFFDLSAKKEIKSLMNSLPVNNLNITNAISSKISNSKVNLISTSSNFVKLYQ